MRKAILLLLIPIYLISCDKKVSKPDNKYFTSIEIDTLLTEDISIRAIVIEDNKVWYGANGGRYGFYDLVTKTQFRDTIKDKKTAPEFRSIASNGKNIFLLNVGNPAFLYKISKDGSEKKVVYTETNDSVFYDSMNFWNDDEGIAVGDPIGNSFSILITRNGGETWTKIPSSELPKTEPGEAAFAASNTNVIVSKNDAWIVSGGKKARVFHTSDKGKSWDVHDTPMAQGLPMTGIFSAAFYDENIGFIVGGDYEKPEQNYGNKALTINGGKTWTLISENLGFGYADCVQFVPNSGGKQLVTVGYSGINYSSDNGKTWKQFSQEKGFYSIRFIDNSTAIAAGKNKIVKLYFKK